ncbi:MAG: protein kinase [Deltaproteobacteria bacterium]|uniref:non-specific serine/threonine protein kinase n=1 Tax=Candidatus Zymogenus saltonus TaxID=2844893 RepID=A0A9D8PP83_9DELT|nr:protein kinase [Candidatus Zymogenus saltonus]
MARKRIGNYEIIEEIGEGGMGIVYKAKQEGLDRIVALKVLLPNLSRKKGFVERFMREARNAAKLDHPNIVTIFEVGTDDDSYFFSMKFVEGEDLADILLKGLLPLKDAVDLTCQIADGLSHAHQIGVIHRDIKPANIIVDKKGRAVITDFGIARAAWEEKLTVTGQSIGTIEYMSHEQFEGSSNLDQRTDVYSLGATFYRMITGASPYPGDTTQEIMYKKIKGDYPEPTKVNPSLPPWVDGVIAKAMEQSRNKRFKTANEFAEALRVGLAGELPKEMYAPPKAVAAVVESKEEPVSVRDEKTIVSSKGGETLAAEPPGDRIKPEAKGESVVITAIGIGALIFLIIVGVVLGLVVKFYFKGKAEGPAISTPSTLPPVETPVPVEEPAPAPEPSPRYGYITGDRVNIRSGPGVSNSVVTKLNRGDGVNILEKKLSGSENEGKLWYNTTVRLDGGGGKTLNKGHAVTVLRETSSEYYVRFRITERNETYYGYVNKGNVKLFTYDYWYKIETSGGTTGWVIDDYVNVTDW